MAQAARCFSTAVILQPLAKRSIIDNRPTLLIYTEKKWLVIIFEQTAYEIFLRQSLFIICISYTVCFSGPCFCVLLKCTQRAAPRRRRECKYQHTLVYLLLFNTDKMHIKYDYMRAWMIYLHRKTNVDTKRRLKISYLVPCNNRFCFLVMISNIFVLCSNNSWASVPVSC